MVYEVEGTVFEFSSEGTQIESAPFMAGMDSVELGTLFSYEGATISGQLLNEETGEAEQGWSFIYQLAAPTTPVDSFFIIDGEFQYEGLPSQNYFMEFTTDSSKRFVVDNGENSSDITFESYDSSLDAFIGTTRILNTLPASEEVITIQVVQESAVLSLADITLSAVWNDKTANVKLEYSHGGAESYHNLTIHRSSDENNDFQEVAELSPSDIKDGLWYDDSISENSTYYYMIEGTDSNGRTLKSNIASVSVADARKPIDMKVWPNPTTDLITIELSEYPSLYNMVSIRILNVDGRIVREDNISANRGNRWRYNVEDLPQGMYFLQITSQGTTRTQQLLKID